MKEFFHIDPDDEEVKEMKKNIEIERHTASAKDVTQCNR